MSTSEIVPVSSEDEEVEAAIPSSHSPNDTPREETTPLLEPHPNPNLPLSSQPKTFANIFIAVVGAGVLGLPYTFKKSGWAAGVLMVLLVAFLSYYCMILLVQTRKKKLQNDRNSSQMASFGDLSFAIWGDYGRMAVDAMIVLSQVGCCVSYIIFISTTLAHLFNNTPYFLLFLRRPKAKFLYVSGMFICQLMLSHIRRLAHLAVFSIFADIVELGSMGTIMVQELMIYMNQKKHVLEAFRGFFPAFYGLGVANYAFEGIGMVLPLESEAANKDAFGRTLGLSMSFISVIYALFGVLGYAAFGEDTRDIVTTNLGKGLVTLLVQLGLCFNLFLTFPVMMNPVHEVMERRFSGQQFCLWLRVVAVLGVTLVALLVPNFADFMSLVGSSVCCILGFVLPAWFHLVTFREEMHRGWVALDILILVFGAVLFVAGTMASLMEMID